MLASFLCGEFLLHILSRLLFFFLFLSREFPSHMPCWLHLYLGSFSYTSRVGLIFIWGVSLTHPMLALDFYAVSFSYTSWAGFIFIRGASFTHPMLASIFIWGVSLTHPVLDFFYLGSFSYTFVFGEFLLHIPCWLNFYLGSFSYTSHVGLIFMWWVSLTHPELASFLCGSFFYTSRAGFLFFYLGSFSYTSRAGFFFIFF